MNITQDDANVDPNSLAACVSRAEVFPSTKVSSSPVTASDLVGSHQWPVPMHDLDSYKRLIQIKSNPVDFGSSKRRGTSLIQPTRGRRDSVSGSNNVSPDSGVSTPDRSFINRPRNSQGLRTMVTSRSLTGALNSPNLFGEF